MTDTNTFFLSILEIERFWDNRNRTKEIIRKMSNISLSRPNQITTFPQLSRQSRRMISLVIVMFWDVLKSKFQKI